MCSVVYLGIEVAYVMLAVELLLLIIITKVVSSLVEVTSIVVIFEGTVVLGVLGLEIVGVTSLILNLSKSSQHCLKIPF